MANITPFAPEKSDLVMNTFWLAQSKSAQGYNVINGYKVQENGTPDMDILIDAGWCNVAWALKNQASQGTLTMVHDDTNPLISTIYVDASGALAKYDGTPAAIDDPLGASDWHQYIAPCVGASIPAGTILAFVYVEAAATAIHNADIWMVPQMGVGRILGEALAGTGQSFTAAHTPLNAQAKLFYNGVRQTPTSDYTISGTGVTLITETVVAGDSLLIDYDFVV
jgi:hypothetical protein